MRKKERERKKKKERKRNKGNSFLINFSLSGFFIHSRNNKRQTWAIRSPPGPFIIGSSTASTRLVAMAASTALPPFCSISSPAPLASGCALATLAQQERKEGEKGQKKMMSSGSEVEDCWKSKHAGHWIIIYGCTPPFPP
jgi:hypothetical protein